MPTPFSVSTALCLPDLCQNGAKNVLLHAKLALGPNTGLTLY